MSIYCSIDFGTTSIKLGLFSDEGGILALEKAPTPASSENGYDPDTVFSIVRNQLDVFDEAFHIDAIAITGMSEAGILLDKDTGEALSGIIPWFDGRTKEISSAYADKDYEGFCITGLHNSFKYGAYKLLWTLGNTVHGEDVIWLSACDWLFYRLTGIYATDPSFAARTYLFDIRDGRWSAERLSLFNIKEGMLPRIVCSGLFSGNTKLNGRDVPVAIAGHDHLLAMYSYEGVVEEYICNSMGTSETFLGTVEKSVLKTSYETGLTYGPYFRKDSLYWMSNIPSAGMSVEWIRKKAVGNESGYPYMDSVISEMPSDIEDLPLFFPWLAGIGTPSYRNDIGGVFWGLKENTSYEDLVRSVFIGLCFQEKRVLSISADDASTPLLVFGGAAKSEPWMQLKADITGHRIIVPSVSEGTLLGAVRLMCDVNGLPLHLNEEGFKSYEPGGRGRGFSDKYDLYSSLSEEFEKIKGEKQ